MDQEYLSSGALMSILATGNTTMKPIVQIMFLKEMSNNKLRAVLGDGQDVVQQCILFSAHFKDIQHQFEKFTVVKITSYSLSAMKNSDEKVILVHDLQILKPGSEVGRKLLPGERFTRPAGAHQNLASMSTAASTPSVSTPSVSTPSRAPLRPQAQQSSLSDQTAKMDGVLFGRPNGGTLRNLETCRVRDLTPFSAGSQILKCKVTSKQEMKTYTNARGEGRLFNFEVCDDTGAIRVTAFNEQCDALVNVIEKGQSLLISRLKVQPADKRYTTHEFSATIQSNSIVETVPDLDATIGEPTITYHFKFLNDVPNYPEGAQIDVIGVIKSVAEVIEFTSKRTNKTMKRRELSLVDKSLAECRVTLWFEEAIAFEGKEGQVLAIKKATVNDFQGKSLSCLQSIVSLDPELAETEELKTWYQNEGRGREDFNKLNQAAEAGGAKLSEYQYIYEINATKTTPNDKAKYFSVDAIITQSNPPSKHLYKACKTCNKKLQDDNSGTLQCPKCHVTTTEYSPRWLLSFSVVDATGQLWVTVFQETAEKLFGENTGKIAEMHNNNPMEYNALVGKLSYEKFSFRLGVKGEEYNNEVRLRATAYNITPLTPKEEFAKLSGLIDILKDQLAG